MADPDKISDSSEFQRIAKAASDLEQTVSAYREYMDVQQQLAEAKQMLKESEGDNTAHAFTLTLRKAWGLLVCDSLFANVFQGTTAISCPSAQCIFSCTEAVRVYSQACRVGS